MLGLLSLLCGLFRLFDFFNVLTFGLLGFYSVRQPKQALLSFDFFFPPLLHNLIPFLKNERNDQQEKR